MSISLYRKYRPQTFSDVIGQKHIVQTLSNAIKNGKTGHAYLFTGPRGTGKTTLARIFAKAVNCQKPKGANPCLDCESCKNIGEGKSLDIFEIDAASNTGVDNIRELRENVKFPPSSARYKVYIIDEVHMLSTGAFNALLKTLEEPPAHVIFILATTEIHKVPETIISRCQRFDFSRLPIDSIIEKLSLIAKSEDISVEKDALEMIAIAAEGGMRDAESLLSQVIALEDKKITAKEAAEILGTSQRQSLEKLAGFILSKNAKEAILLVNQLSQDGYDLDVFNKSFLNYLRQAMLVSVDEKLADTFSHELTKEQTKNLLGQVKGAKPKDLLHVTSCFLEIQGKIKSAFIPQLPLEMAIIKATEKRQESSENSRNPISGSGILSGNLKRSESPETAPVSAYTPKSDQIPAPVNEPEIKQNVKSQEAAKNENSGGFSISIQEVKKCWNQAVLEIKQLNHSLSAVLQSCQPVKAEDGILSIATKFPFHRDKLNEHPNKLTLESVFGKILGMPLKVLAVTNEDAGIKSASNDKPRTAASNEPKETSLLLTDALGILGGQIVE